MRALRFVVTVLCAGCATAQVAVESVFEQASENEVAAVNAVKDVDVVVTGEILDFAFLKSRVDVTRTTSNSRTESTAQQRLRPYVSVQTRAGRAFCFPWRPDALDKFKKGDRVKLVGTFTAFSRNDAGELQASLSDCRPVQ